MWPAKFAVPLVLALFASFLPAGEPEPLAPPVTFRFGGGEHIKLIVVPDAGGASIEQFVSFDGFIAVPGSEPLNIRNKTIVEAHTLVNEKIKEGAGVRKLSVSIALLSIPTRHAYVGGDGVKTGLSVPISGGAPVTLYAAVLAAGGIAPDGDPTRVSLSRVQPDGSIKAEIVDVSHFGEPGNNSLGPVLQDGDLIKVPRGESFVLAGEVTKPGPVNKRELAAQTGNCLRLSCVLYATGGLKPGANRKSVRILRNGKDGKKFTITVDLDALEKNIPGNRKVPADAALSPDKPAPDLDPMLQDGDIVVAAPTGGIPVLGRVRLPSVVPIGGQSIKLSRVIAMAGGFADFAKMSSVTVLKGGTAPMPVDMSKMKDGNFHDPELEDGDIVVVGERLL